MRARALAIALVLLGAGCSAIDGFGFQFSDAGTTDAGPDLAPPPAGFGQPCVAGQCAAGLVCITQFPNGICVRPCNRQLPGQCLDLKGDCVEIANNTDVCLPHCDVTLGPFCARGAEGYGCCANGNVLSSGMGTCAPAQSMVCHN